MRPKGYIGISQVWRGGHQNGGEKGLKNIPDIENMQWSKADKEIFKKKTPEVIQYVWTSTTSRGVDRDEVSRS